MTPGAAQPPPVPTPRQCRDILAAHQVPPHIQRHSEQVARVARALAEALVAAGEPLLDPDRLTAAALLHDIAKARCLDDRRDHALEGGKVLRGLGMVALAELVERHVRIGPWDRIGAVTEAELLNYSDKRVRHEEIVTLDERFRDLMVRYGKENRRAQAAIRENWETTAAMERKIFGRLGGAGDLLAELLTPDGR